MALRPTELYLDEIEIKKSRFIGLGYPISSVEEGRDILKNIKLEYSDSRHVCYGLLWGVDSTHMGMSDDGEPSGTAGRPILEVLKGSGYENILVAVVRYFGGTKLGTGGLVKAYTEITKQIVEGIKVEPYIECREAKLTVPYALYNQLKILLDSYQYLITNEKFETDIKVNFLIRLDSELNFENDLQNLSNGILSICEN